PRHLGTIRDVVNVDTVPAANRPDRDERAVRREGDRVAADEGRRVDREQLGAVTRPAEGERDARARGRTRAGEQRAVRREGEAPRRGVGREPPELASIVGPPGEDRRISG